MCYDRMTPKEAAAYLGFSTSTLENGAGARKFGTKRTVDRVILR